MFLAGLRDLFRRGPRRPTYEELVNLLAEAHEAGLNACDESSDPLSIACGNCDAAIPLEHSLGCRMADAVHRARR